MFQTLYKVYTRFRGPSARIWLNIWSYSSTNSWTFLSNELLSFYTESLGKFRTLTITTIHKYPSEYYTIVLVIGGICSAGLILG